VGELLDGVGPRGLEDEISICRGLRPDLPSDIEGLDQLAPYEIGLGDQHVDGLDRSERRLGRFGLVASSRQQRGYPASGDGDTEYNETRGFHYASLPK
jgi:hypothetical protein